MKYVITSLQLQPLRAVVNDQEHELFALTPILPVYLRINTTSRKI